MIRPSATIGGVLIGIAGVVAGVVVLVGFDAGARAFLRFEFGGAGQSSLEIAGQNARIVAAALLSAAAVPRLRTARVAFDVLVLGTLGANAALVGVAIGAYGERLVRVIALHGSVELVAMSLGGGAYLIARDHVLGAGELCCVAAASAALLIVAGMIETSVQIGGLR